MIFMGYFLAQTTSTLISSSSQYNDTINALDIAGITHYCFLGCSYASQTCPFCKTMNNMSMLQPYFWRIVSDVFGSSIGAQEYCDSVSAILPMSVSDVSSIVLENNSTFICCRPYPFL